MGMRRPILLAALAFLALVVAANVLTARYGLVPVGLGLMATAGTWAAGLVLLARDAVDDFGGRAWVLGCITAGGALSALSGAGVRLALASAVAFTLAELGDWAVYRPLRERGWGRAAIASGVAGALLDTIVFLAIAGFPIRQALPGQMYVKVLATVVVVGLVTVGRAVLRNRVRTEGA